MPITKIEKSLPAKWRFSLSRCWPLMTEIPWFHWWRCLMLKFLHPLQPVVPLWNGTAAFLSPAVFHNVLWTNHTGNPSLKLQGWLQGHQSSWLHSPTSHWLQQAGIEVVAMNLWSVTVKPGLTIASSWRRAWFCSLNCSSWESNLFCNASFSAKRSSTSLAFLLFSKARWAFWYSFSTISSLDVAFLASEDSSWTIKL